MKPVTLITAKSVEEFTRLTHELSMPLVFLENIKPTTQAGFYFPVLHDHTGIIPADLIGLSGIAEWFTRVLKDGDINSSITDNYLDTLIVALVGEETGALFCPMDKYDMYLKAAEERKAVIKRKNFVDTMLPKARAISFGGNIFHIRRTGKLGVTCFFHGEEHLIPIEHLYNTANELALFAKDSQVYSIGTMNGGCIPTNYPITGVDSFAFVARPATEPLSNPESHTEYDERDPRVDLPLVALANGEILGYERLKSKDGLIADAAREIVAQVLENIAKKQSGTKATISITMPENMPDPTAVLEEVVRLIKIANATTN